MSQFVLSYTVLCEVLIKGLNFVEPFLYEEYPHLSENDIFLITSEIKKRFFSHFKRRYMLVSYNQTKFFERYMDWLNSEFVVKLETNNNNTDILSDSTRGRPNKDFTSCTDRAKRYKVDKLRSSVSQDLINAASSSKLKGKYFFKVN